MSLCGDTWSTAGVSCGCPLCHPLASEQKSLPWQRRGSDVTSEPQEVFATSLPRGSKISKWSGVPLKDLQRGGAAAEAAQ